MTEMAHAGEDHRQAVLVRGRDDFGVPLRAARLDHGRDAVLGGVATTVRSMLQAVVEKI